MPTHIVTCRVEGCTAADVAKPMVLAWTDVDGIAHLCESVVCGGSCGGQITDISDVPDNDTADSEGA